MQGKPSPKAAVGISDTHRRDLEMILIGMALASSEDARQQMAVDFGGQDIAEGGLLSREAYRVIDAIARKDRETFIGWLGERGVNLERGVTTQQAIAGRFEAVARLARVRRLSKRLTFYDNMSADEIAAVAAEIVRCTTPSDPQSQAQHQEPSS